MTSVRWIAGRALTLMLLLAAGCGGEYSPGPAGDGRGEVDDTFAGYSDDDTSTTSIRLTTSAEYDEATDAVRIYALVKDQDRNALLQFNQHNFTVTLNSSTAPQSVDSDRIAISIEASQDRIVALVIDSSGSMSYVDPLTGKSRMEAAKDAASLFVELMDPSDRAAIVTFSDKARTVQPLTGDKALLESAIRGLSPEGATNFGAAIIEAASAVGTRAGRRAMVLLTDGDDTVDSVTGGPGAWLGNDASSRYQGLLLAQEDDFSIFTVGLGLDLSPVGLADLETLALETGGEFFQAADERALTTVFGSTIPAAIDQLTPVETYVLEFSNDFHPAPGQELSVRYVGSVLYPTGNGTLFDTSSGTYWIH